MLQRAELQTIGENCEKFNSLQAERGSVRLVSRLPAPAPGMGAFKLIKAGWDD